MQEYEVFSRKIYISNIPRSATKENVRHLFAICGQIESVSLYSFKDSKNERFYGFVEFSDVSSARKAAFFNEKVYRKHILYVRNHKEATYNVYVKNLQSHVNENLLKVFFEGYGAVKAVTTPFPRTVIVNFEDNSARLRVLSAPVVMPGVGQLTISLAEPYNKMDYTNHLASEHFTVNVSNIPCRVSKEELQTMFELFGPIISTNIVVKGARFNYGFVNFATTIGMEAALKFNGEKPDGWEMAISIASQNNECKSPPANITKNPMPKPLVDSFSVKVTGFGIDVQEDTLRRFFASAGTIMECFIQLADNGDRYAIINYERADCVTKAISYSDCFIGSPSKQIKVVKPPQVNKLSAAKSTFNLAAPNPPEKLQRAVSELSLSGKSAFLVVVDNVPKKMKVETVQRLFSNCGTMLQPPEIVCGEMSNMVKIFFATRESAEMARAKHLPPGTGGKAMECYISQTNLPKAAFTNQPSTPPPPNRFPFYTRVELGVTKTVPAATKNETTMNLSKTSFTNQPPTPSPSNHSPYCKKVEEMCPTATRNDIVMNQRNTAVKNSPTTSAPSLSHMTVEHTPPAMLRNDILRNPRANIATPPTPTISPKNHPVPAKSPPAVARVEPIRRTLSDHKLANVNVFSFDKFQNWVHINSGGFGRVFKASTLQSGLVAVKRFLCPASKDTEREIINMINHSTHPNIVRFLGIVTMSERSQDIIGFVMEYLGDQTVYHATHVSSMPLPLRMKYSWICQAARGLDYLHSRQIVHRDVKTLNMLLDNSYKHLRVCDLGISKNCNENLTGGMYVGTKEYTAPEVLRASGQSQNEYDTKADVYSLGICIWEILTKMKPYDPLMRNISNVAFCCKVMNEGLRPDCSLIADLSIRPFVSRCWAYSPSQRPSMEEIVMFFDKQEREISF